MAENCNNQYIKRWIMATKRMRFNELRKGQVFLWTTMKQQGFRFHKMKQQGLSYTYCLHPLFQPKSNVANFPISVTALSGLTDFTLAFTIKNKITNETYSGEIDYKDDDEMKKGFTRLKLNMRQLRTIEVTKVDLIDNR